MSRIKIAVLATAAVLLGIGIWELNAYFSATVDWPLVVLNAKADALKAKEENGNYFQAPFGQDLSDMLTKKGIAGQVSLVGADDGQTAAVVVTGLSARSCLGLQHHPDLVSAFDSIKVQDGDCADNSTLTFRFK